MGSPWQSASALNEHYVTAFFYGPTRTAKTTICASFPKPLFLIPRNEGSEETIRGLPFIVRKIESMADMREAVEFLQARAQDRTLRRDWAETVCVESLTHYAEIVMLELTKGGKLKMEWELWGQYSQHFTWLRDALFSLPVHRVFTALDKTKVKGDRVIGGGISIAGQTAELLGSSCDILGYCDRDAQGQFVTHLQPFGHFKAGTRIRGMQNASFVNFRFDTHIAPFLNGAAPMAAQ